MALRSACRLHRFARHHACLGPSPSLSTVALSRRMVTPHLGVCSGASRALSNVKLPTKEDAASMPVAVCELSNETLIILAEQGCHEACTERLVRNIMHTDDVEWRDAKDKQREIAAENRKVLWLVTLPYKVGIGAAFFAGVGSIPMVFSCTLAKWFNAHFVTTEVPEKADLETMLEVGSWTWNWMEPPLGTASFVLLALQFCRAQMLNMNLTPYTSWVQDFRAKRLQEKFPQYNSDAKPTRWTPSRSQRRRWHEGACDSGEMGGCRACRHGWRQDIIMDYARTASLKPMKFR